VTAVAHLSLACGSDQYVPLPNRMILYFTHQEDCGIDVGQAAEETSYTDALGNASVNLVFADTGQSRLRVRFQGESKPEPCPDTGNNACLPTDSDSNKRCVNIASSNDCVTLVVLEQSIPIYIDAGGPVNLIVIDPNQDSIGLDFNTIGNAAYTAYNDSIYIVEALAGNYFIKVVEDTSDQSGDSSYGLDARIDGTADNPITSNSPVPQEGEEHNYVITSQPGIPECLSQPGDANGNSVINLVDVISVVNYVFNHAGCLPLPDCWLWGLNCRGDWNGNGSITTSDAVAGVNFIFGKPGGPWTPVATEACCLPVQ